MMRNATGAGDKNPVTRAQKKWYSVLHPEAADNMLQFIRQLR